MQIDRDIISIDFRKHFPETLLKKAATVRICCFTPKKNSTVDGRQHRLVRVIVGQAELDLTVLSSQAPVGTTQSLRRTNMRFSTAGQNLPFMIS